MRIGLVEAYLQNATVAPGETRLWVSVGTIMRQCTPDRRADKTCVSYVNSVAATNRLYLAGYLQGFVSECEELHEKHLGVSATVNCPCARVCDVQTLINLARLARHLRKRCLLASALDRLDEVLAEVRKIDPGRIPGEIGISLRNGSFFEATAAIREIETAKFHWLMGNTEACLSLVGPLVSGSRTAVELAVRCLIELGRFDAAIAIATEFVQRHDWLRDYAVIALLRGQAGEVAESILPFLDGYNPLIRFRVIGELIAHGLLGPATELTADLAGTAIRNGEEPSVLLVHALVLEAGAPSPEGLATAARAIASTSRHFPAVILHAGVLAGRCAQPTTAAGEGLEGQTCGDLDARMDAARLDLDARANGLRSRMACHA